MYEKIVVVTRRTRLEELVARFNTRAQARFYIEHAGGDFSDYQREDDIYRAARDTLRHGLDLGLKIQFVDRSLIPTFVFARTDLVVTLGQDGLVANTAKGERGHGVQQLSREKGLEGHRGALCHHERR